MLIAAVAASAFVSSAAARPAESAPAVPGGNVVVTDMYAVVVPDGLALKPADRVIVAVRGYAPNESVQGSVNDRLVYPDLRASSAGIVRLVYEVPRDAGSGIYDLTLVGLGRAIAGSVPVPASASSMTVSVTIPNLGRLRYQVHAA